MRYSSFTRGFTLIELLVVIAIIGILASIVLASLDSARKKGRDARRVADVKQIQLALELYYDSTGSFPLTQATLYSGTISPQYISNVPYDPVGSNVKYSYTGLAGSGGSATNCQSYHLGATLEDPNNAALNSDFDATTAGTYGTGVQDGTACGTDFAGTDPIYDVRP